MKALPLSKEIYNKAIELSVETITLKFSGGNDEGYLDVTLEPWGESNAYNALRGDIEEWAWKVYSYSGAGEGRDYGDDITYDLKNKNVITSYWHLTEQHSQPESDSLKIGR